MDLKIPAGTQPGTTLVMSKRGVPRLGSSTIRGDHQAPPPPPSSLEVARYNLQCQKFLAIVSQSSENTLDQGDGWMDNTFVLSVSCFVDVP